MLFLITFNLYALINPLMKRRKHESTLLTLTPNRPRFAACCFFPICNCFSADNLSMGRCWGDGPRGVMVKVLDCGLEAIIPAHVQVSDLRSPSACWILLNQQDFVVYTVFLQSVNLLSFLLRCSTRPHKWGTQWESNSLV